MTYSPNPAGKSWNVCMQEINTTLDKWKATEGKWTCAMSNRATGTGRNHWSLSFYPEKEVGVTLTFRHKDGTERTVSVDKFGCPRDNLWAIAIGLEQLRLNELRGLDDVAREFYLALPAPVRKRSPWEVLGLPPGADLDVIEAVYRTKAKRLHPDAGGEVAAFIELQEAYEAVKSP